MTAYPDPSDRPAVPAGSGSRSRRMKARRLWSAGIATAVVAALIALVGVLVVRVLLRVDVDASPAPTTTVLCAMAAAAALGATGLAHLLIVSTPRPLSYFSWIVGLLTTAAAVVPFTYAASPTVALAQAVIHVVIGLAIGRLVAGAAASALRSVAMSPRPFNVE